MLNGTLDVSPKAELAISGDQLRDLHARTRTAGVHLHVVALSTGKYAATVAGRGRLCTAEARDPYSAGIRALEKVA